MMTDNTFEAQALGTLLTFDLLNARIRAIQQEVMLKRKIRGKPRRFTGEHCCPEHADLCDGLDIVCSDQLQFTPGGTNHVDPDLLPLLVKVGQLHLAETRRQFSHLVTFWNNFIHDSSWQPLGPLFRYIALGCCCAMFEMDAALKRIQLVRERDGRPLTLDEQERNAFLDVIIRVLLVQRRHTFLKLPRFMKMYYLCGVQELLVKFGTAVQRETFRALVPADSGHLGAIESRDLTALPLPPPLLSLVSRYVGVNRNKMLASVIEACNVHLAQLRNAHSPEVRCSSSAAATSDGENE